MVPKVQNATHSGPGFFLSSFLSGKCGHFVIGDVATETWERQSGGWASPECQQPEPLGLDGAESWVQAGKG